MVSPAVTAHLTGPPVDLGTSAAGMAIGGGRHVLSRASGAAARFDCVPRHGRRHHDDPRGRARGRASIAAVCVCAGLADLMSTGPAPRMVRAITYLAGAGADVAGILAAGLGGRRAVHARPAPSLAGVCSAVRALAPSSRPSRWPRSSGWSAPAPRAARIHGQPRRTAAPPA